MAEDVRILHLLFPARVGGLETVVATLASGQAEQGMPVMVAVLVEGEGEADDWRRGLEKQGVEVRPLPVRGRRYLAERKAVGGLLRSWRPKVFHSHGYRPDVVDAPVARGLGIPTVTTVHGFTGGGLKNRFYEWLQMQAFRRFDAVVAVSRKLAGELRQAGVPGERIHLVQNAWTPPSGLLPRKEARTRLGLNEQVPVVGWIGRLSPEKAPELMIKAFSRVSAPAARLVMMGGGSMRGELEEMARGLGVGDRIRLPGIVPEAYRVLKAFDVLALSSRMEGTPMVLLEAMAAGVPIVSTAVGGVPEMLSQQEASLVPGGDEQALAEAIGSVFLDPSGATLRAAQALLRFEREFSVGPWVERYTEIYRGLLS